MGPLLLRPCSLEMAVVRGAPHPALAHGAACVYVCGGVHGARAAAPWGAGLRSVPASPPPISHGGQWRGWAGTVERGWQGRWCCPRSPSPSPAPWRQQYGCWHCSAGLDPHFPHSSLAATGPCQKLWGGGGLRTAGREGEGGAGGEGVVCGWQRGRWGAAAQCKLPPLPGTWEWQWGVGPCPCPAPLSFLIGNWCVACV